MFLQNIKIKDVKIEMGALVKGLRKQNKLTQEELANALDLSRITIQNLESGKNFTIDTFLKVVKHFDMLKDFNDFVLKMKESSTNLGSYY